VHPFSEHREIAPAKIDAFPCDAVGCAIVASRAVISAQWSTSFGSSPTRHEMPDLYVFGEPAPRTLVRVQVRRTSCTRESHSRGCARCTISIGLRPRAYIRSNVIHCRLSFCSPTHGLGCAGSRLTSPPRAGTPRSRLVRPITEVFARICRVAG
jgi:hypothetical protein